MGEGLASACQRTVWGMGLPTACGGTASGTASVGGAVVVAKWLISFEIDASYRSRG
jgi:hypothetical protein